MNSNFYDFTALSIGGREIPMSDYRGKVVLVVNTASKCGFTPQYKDLEALYQKYRDDGLVILGFPCNQFGGQEPGDESTIVSGCLVNYGVTFPMFSKVKVNGRDAHPLYVFLKKQLRGLLGGRIKWNFTKFLLNRCGQPVKRFAPNVNPASMGPHIERLLHQHPECP